MEAQQSDAPAGQPLDGSAPVSSGEAGGITAPERAFIVDPSDTSWMYASSASSAAPGSTPVPHNLPVERVPARRTKTAALVAFCMIALVGAGVAVASRSSERLDVALSRAGAATLESGSAKVQMQMRMTGQGQQLDMTVSGGIDFSHRMGSLDMDLELPQALDLPAGSGHFEMVFVGDMVFVRSPLLASQAGDRWIKVDAAAVVDGMNLGAALHGGSDQSGALEMLQMAGGGAQVVGREQVRGVDTTHYVATLDLADLMAASGADSPALRDAVAQLGLSSIPLEAWVDDAGRVRKMTIDYEVSGMRAHVVAEYYDFGQPVEVTVPALADTVDLTSMLSMGASGA